MKKKCNLFLLYSIILASICIVITIYRAVTISITYDEAYTYMYYAKNFEFKNLLVPFLANNHILNSILINITNNLFKIDYNEFIIRLPNILFSFLYYFFAYKFSSNKKNKFALITCLFLNYGFNEFFGLARGYGIAVSLIMIGIYYYDLWLKNYKNYNYIILSFFFFILSTYANTVCLIIFGAILIHFLQILIKKNIFWDFIKRKILYLIPFILFTCLSFLFHLSVAREGFPLYGSTENYFKSVILELFNISGIATRFSLYAFIILITSLIIILIMNYKKILKCNYFFICIYWNILTIVTTLIFKQQWMTGRSLLPPLILFIIMIIELYSLPTNKIYTKILNFTIIIISIITFALNINLTQVKDWKYDKDTKEVAYKAYYCYNDDEIINQKIDNKRLTTVSIDFYRNKIMLYYNYDIYSYNLEGEKK